MKVPMGLTNKVGQLALRRGKAQPGSEVSVWSFDAIRECIMDRCPAYNECPYKSRDNKCGVELSYVRSVWGMIYDNFSERFSEPFLFRVGMHLIPLYKGLCRMKLEELSVDRVTIVSPKGDIKVHPIYNEIRNQMNAIDREWGKMGIDKELIAPPLDGGLIDAN